MNDRCMSWTFGEGRTSLGQVVKFEHPTDVSGDSIREFLKANVRSITIPTAHRASVGHGGYGQYSRFTIEQHKYAGGGYPGNGGYIEVLEIKNPPDGRWGIVINEHTSLDGTAFSEWESLADALAVFEQYWGSGLRRTKEAFPTLRGFKRRVECCLLRPWFYAIGDEELIGDYAFPEGLQDDEVFRLGKQFIVYSREGVSAIKICMGTRYVKKESDYYPYDVQQFRIVCWDDGTMWDESKAPGTPPRPAEEGELWISEAVEQFRQFLAGRSTQFVINFTDGNKFVGKLVQPDRPRFCAEGRYSLVVHLKDGKKKEGWVDFIPTGEYTNVVQYVTEKLAKKGEEVVSVKVKKCETKKGGKKWEGVFLAPSMRQP